MQTARRWCCAGSGCSRICWARRPPRLRPTCRRWPRATDARRRRCASGWSSIGQTRSARAATLGWTRSDFAMEHFDAIGRWRENDGGADINATITWKGDTIDSPRAFREALLASGDEFMRTVAEKLMIYMRWGAGSTTTTSRRCDGSCAASSRMTTAGLRSCSGWWPAIRSRCAARPTTTPGSPRSNRSTQGPEPAAS